MTDFLQLLTSGLALGAIYALVALGFVVIYRSSQVFNFAQGELVTLGAFTMITLSGWGLPWAVALVGSMVITGAIAAGIERAALRPLVGRPVFVTIILTIFIGFVLRALIIIGWGTESRGMPAPWDPTATVDIAGATVLTTSLWTLFAGAITLGSFFVLIRYTRLGVAMRATAGDQEASLGVGIPVGRIFGASWFIAGLYATLAGVFLAMFPRSADPNLGYIALRAFPAVIVGGLDSALGTVIAGLLLGVLEVMTQAYINPELGSFGHGFHSVFPYVVMILFLVVRPYGLFGRKEVERV